MSEPTEPKKRSGMSFGTASVILALASCASYAVGLFRDRLFAHVYGASPSLDAFYASFTIPDLLFNLFIAGITSHVVFVPVLMQYFQQHEESRAWRLANSFLNVSIVIITLVAIVAFFIMPTLTHLVAPGFTGDQFTLTVNLTRIMLIQPILFGVSNAFGSILVSLKRFSAYAFAPALYNLCMMLVTFLFYKQWGIYAAIIGVVIGAAVHLLVRLWDIWYTSYRYRWAWDTQDPGFKTMIKLVIPKTIGLFAAQANIYAFTAIGSLMAVGSIAIFNFAMNLQSFPVSLVGIGMATAALPLLSEHAQGKDREAFSREMRRALRYILFLSLPSTAGMLILNNEIVRIILKTGAFDLAAANATAGVLVFMIIAITFENVKHLLARGYYAYQDTLMPLIISVVGAIVSIALCWYLRTSMGVAAFGVGFLAGEVIQVVILQLGLKKQLLKAKTHEVLHSFLKVCAATSVMSVCTYLIKTMLTGQSVYLVGSASILVGAVVYFGFAWLIKMPELSILPSLIKKLTRRTT